MAEGKLVTVEEARDALNSVEITGEMNAPMYAMSAGALTTIAAFLSQAERIEAAARAVLGDDEHMQDCASVTYGNGNGPCDCEMKALRAALAESSPSPAGLDDSRRGHPTAGVGGAADGAAPLPNTMIVESGGGGETCVVCGGSGTIASCELHETMASVPCPACHNLCICGHRREDHTRSSGRCGVPPPPYIPAFGHGSAYEKTVLDKHERQRCRCARFESAKGET